MEAQRPMLQQLYDVSGRTIVVTGAGRGIGRWIAEGLGSVGANVVAASRTIEECEVVAEVIRSGGGQAQAVEADICRPDECDRLIAETVDRFGAIDVLINNAGATSRRLAAFDIDETDYHRTVDTNVKGTFFASKAAARVMAERGGGKIVNFASTAASLVRMGVPNTVYAAAKAGVIQMTRGLAAEWAPLNINVNCIAPGRFVVERNRKFTSPGTPEYEAVMRSIPMGRTGGGDDIIGPVLFLSSDAARYVTGQTLFVDGGRTVL
ncbi:MAG: glucose 1-dehydrogenase [Chloroflexota bacterium]